VHRGGAARATEGVARKLRCVDSALLLSVLDQSPIAEGSTGADALHNTIDLAQLTEALGYRRYWVAEHHATSMLAGPAPEVLIAAIASATSTIRVGSGGVMLPHYSPLKVAETFSVLCALYGDRIDLGIGRAPGTDQATAFALQRDRRVHAADDFPEQLAELIAYLDASFPQGHPLARLALTLPGRPIAPALWLLGSSPQSAIWAAELGLPYSFADFINPLGAEIAKLYRERFVPSADLAAPRLAVAVSVICAETDEQAERLAASSRMAIVQLRRGRPGVVPPIETALEFLSDVVPSEVSGARRFVVGSPERVRAGIEGVAAEYGAEEVAIVTITYDHAARRRSYELIASAFGL
jgi:luciferase family oxidoreductase group 1